MDYDDGAKMEEDEVIGIKISHNKFPFSGGGATTLASMESLSLPIVCFLCFLYLL